MLRPYVCWAWHTSTLVWRPCERACICACMQRSICTCTTKLEPSCSIRWTLFICKCINYGHTAYLPSLESTSMHLCSFSIHQDLDSKCATSCIYQSYYSSIAGAVVLPAFERLCGLLLLCTARCCTLPCASVIAWHLKPAPACSTKPSHNGTL